MYKKRYVKLELMCGILLFLLLTACFNNSSREKDTMNTFEWTTIDSIPDAFGFAGGFSGISNNALIFIGGANFPDGLAPWSGGVKKWYSNIYVLDNIKGKWKQLGNLPISLGYGVSVTYNNKLLVIGGSNENGHSDKVYSIEYTDGVIAIDSLPSLPFTLANSCGAVVNDIIYVAGGLIQDSDPNTQSVFLSLNLKELDKGWQQLPTYPGDSRMLSVAGVYKDQFILLSGVSLIEGKRKYLKDAYSYHPTTGWKTLSELPYAVAAAPSFAYTKNDRLFVFGGDNGALAPQASELKENHPGFETSIAAYDFNTAEWTLEHKILTDIKPNASSNPNESVWAPVTTNLVVWNDLIVIPSGEVRPAVRTPKVLVATYQ